MTTNEPREYLLRVGQALRYMTRPPIDPVRSLGVNHPGRFSLLLQSWQGCLDAAHTVHSRYDEDRNSGPLAASAVQVRDISLAALATTWEQLVDAYLADIHDEKEQNRG